MKTAPNTTPATAPPSLGSSSEPITVLLFVYAPCQFACSDEMKNTAAECMNGRGSGVWWDAYFE